MVDDEETFRFTCKPGAEEWTFLFLGYFMINLSGLVALLAFGNSTLALPGITAIAIAVNIMLLLQRFPRAVSIAIDYGSKLLSYNEDDWQIRSPRSFQQPWEGCVVVVERRGGTRGFVKGIRLCFHDGSERRIWCKGGRMARTVIALLARRMQGPGTRRS